jgi:hypothetical protein
MSAAQLRYMAEALAPYGENGCADITTRANIQLRGVVLEDADKIIAGLKAHGMHSFCSGMDNVRNLTGNPIAGARRGGWQARPGGGGAAALRGGWWWWRRRWCSCRSGPSRPPEGPVRLPLPRQTTRLRPPTHSLPRHAQAWTPTSWWTHGRCSTP